MTTTTFARPAQPVAIPLGELLPGAILTILNAAPTPTQRVGCDEDNSQAGSIASATTSATSLLQEFSFIKSFQTIFCPI